MAIGRILSGRCRTGRSGAAAKKNRMDFERPPCAKKRTKHMSAVRPVTLARKLRGVVVSKGKRRRSINKEPATDVVLSDRAVRSTGNLGSCGPVGRSVEQRSWIGWTRGGIERDRRTLKTAGKVGSASGTSCSARTARKYSEPTAEDMAWETFVECEQQWGQKTAGL